MPRKHTVNLGGGKVVEIEGVEDVDLDQESITVSGERLTEASAARLTDAILTPGRGRPSIDQAASKGHRSPQVAFRVSTELKAELSDIAQRDGRRESDVLRQALEEYVMRHKSA